MLYYSRNDSSGLFYGKMLSTDFDVNILQILDKKKYTKKFQAIDYSIIVGGWLAPYKGSRKKSSSASGLTTKRGGGFRPDN